MNNMRTMTLALLLISLVVAPAFAQRDGWGQSSGKDNNREKHIEQLAQLLDLTPEQEADVKDIIAENQQRISDQREKQQTNRQEIQELVAAETLNETRLKELVNEQSELRAEGMITRHTTRNRINQVLTPEQQEKHQVLRQMRSQHKKSGKRYAGGKAAKAM